MNEAEWLETTSVRKMLKFLRGYISTRRRNVSTRKRRLFAVACCRRILALINDDRSQNALEVAELYAEGRATGEQLALAERGAYQASSAAYGAMRLVIMFARDAARSATNVNATRAAWCASRDAAIACAKPTSNYLGRKEDPSERAAQSQLLRDLVGNPFHLLPPRPEAIAPLAERIYAGEWNLMPLLGEWLQEHGFWSEGEHCLDPRNQHVKGCWVVDWVMGRE